MDTNRINEMLGVAEAAAFAAGGWIGKGKKDLADAAAVEAMRDKFNTLDISGRIVIGEGERDEAPMLYIGEELGKGGEEIDIAVDPLEGTNLCAFAQPNALAVLAFAPRGALLYAPDTYMEKIAAGPAAADAIDIDATPAQNIRNVAAALGKPVEEVVVCVLDRDRHQELIAAIREAGARVRQHQEHAGAALLPVGQHDRLEPAALAVRIGGAGARHHLRAHLGAVRAGEGGRGGL